MECNAAINYETLYNKWVLLNLKHINVKNAPLKIDHVFYVRMYIEQICLSSLVVTRSK